MIKSQELDNFESCLNKAAIDEPLFVLRGKDACAAETVRTWARLRLAAQKNQADDIQISSALAIAEAMEEYAARRAREEQAEAGARP